MTQAHFPRRTPISRLRSYGALVPVLLLLLYALSRSFI